ncbi:unnamed protein product [Strongylus vulgaris]|uniref:Uncharacterized protein n=1 Tax=Strongylus vulgaris TaxID=40348 RepID=A0A3P7LJQ9_STRVU|nr:unnamed protein product [Strongylus vulgaris]
MIPLKDTLFPYTFPFKMYLGAAHIISRRRRRSPTGQTKEAERLRATSRVWPSDFYTLSQLDEDASGKRGKLLRGLRHRNALSTSREEFVSRLRLS